MNEFVDSIIERDREKLIASLQESIRIPSTEAAAEPGAPFGRNVSEALHHALATAADLGLKRPIWKATSAVSSLARARRCSALSAIST